MIIKKRRPDGRTVHMVQCDTCTVTAPLLGSVRWLIPAHPGMPVHCPPCVQAHAKGLINDALS